jgi:hypothetical protein
LCTHILINPAIFVAYNNTRKSGYNTYRGWTQIDAKTGTEIQTGRKKECGTAEEEMEGPTPL